SSPPSSRAGRDATAEGIEFIQQQRRIAVHKGAARDRWDDLLALTPIAAPERTANDALLNPLDSFGKFFVRRQARELGAGARAAWRAIVSFTGTEHEVSRIRAGLLRRPKQFDVVHFRKSLGVDCF